MLGLYRGPQAGHRPRGPTTHASGNPYTLAHHATLPHGPTRLESSSKTALTLKQSGSAHSSSRDSGFKQPKVGISCITWGVKGIWRTDPTTSKACKSMLLVATALRRCLRDFRRYGARGCCAQRRRRVIDGLHRRWGCPEVVLTTCQRVCMGETCQETLHSGTMTCT